MQAAHTFTLSGFIRCASRQESPSAGLSSGYNLGHPSVTGASKRWTFLVTCTIIPSFVAEHKNASSPWLCQVELGANFFLTD
jgi:hypothetical protein